jgi:hypothetical protein
MASEAECQLTGQFVANLFLARDVAHRAHLATRSLAVHLALDEFYKTLPGLADALAEQFQGEFNELLEIPFQQELLDVRSVPKAIEGPIVAFLDKQKTWIEANRYKCISKDQTSLHNTIDEIVSLYQTTLYKLRFLS